MAPDTTEVVLLTLQVASLATVAVFVPSVVAAYFFSRRQGLGWQVLFTLLGLPMVLPPTAVGFLLLRLFAMDGPLGSVLQNMDLNILLTWQAAVVAAAVMALPIVIRTARVAFDSVDPQLEMVSRTLGHGPVKTFLITTLPLASRGLLAAAILGFTRAVGEFGATVTIAGNIPGRTQTLASAIFSAQQVGRDAEAYALIGVSLGLGFVAIFSTEFLIRRSRKVAR